MAIHSLSPSSSQRADQYEPDAVAPEEVVPELPQGLGQPAARARFQDDTGPPDALPDAPRVVGDVFETRASRPKA